MSSTNPRRPGRRTGDSTTRDDILRAAQSLFGSNGFKNTSMRAVAAEAGVDVALVPYYFGSKRGLFVAALEVPVDPVAQVVRATQGPRERLGERMAAEFTAVWEHPDTSSAMRGLLRSVITDESESSAYAEFMSTEMVPLVAELTGVSLETARVAVSMLFGMATMRYLIGVPLFVELSRDEVIALWGPHLQRVIDAD
ncbi:TetR family transcriptional regulator [Gordonia pseudamarae]|jgi:AcrR family transcriptional regulator|uniref:TetR family transcriptional regulator n=1 Tax=Gordonia pseudamarae TaxID=2831662 RepID=A0ABX6IJW3_9ACTN|nr:MULTISPECIES: TetR family transcriptional regulator [Gordonia]MBD0024076.1 TetR/AcrR family transcriptional regulator [Gordonia sp. (in: high G+C Gram-positive bacteria)]QHN26625.1 TetR family transcriptional regulator [Gordonia pseudamarae]QHN35518.1 TetR family transcriptional regulator [Gordonia pseudamarae]